MAYTIKDFIKASKEKHGNTYVYTTVVYENAHADVVIKCRKHGEFKQKPMVHLRGAGCPVCAQDRRNKTRTLSSEEFIKRAKQKHGRKFDYSKVEYKNSTTRITVGCKKHGDFTISPNGHMNGYGCTKCCYEGRAERRLSNREEFLKKAKEVHGSKYSYKKSEYTKASVNIIITCKEHGDFLQTPNNHLSGKGCSDCTVCVNFSNIAIEWIEKEAKRRRLKSVQHALKGGEFRIPGTRLRVDGFHARSNTIFEFYGDCFHGNPTVYKPRSYPNPLNKKLTAKQLYTKTMEREYLLKSLGYNVVSMWEYDYRNSK
jgi:hypothetical protein